VNRVDRARLYLTDYGFSPARVKELTGQTVEWGWNVKRRGVTKVRGIRNGEKTPEAIEREDRLREAVHAVLAGVSVERAAKKHKVQTFEVVAAVHNARLEIKRLAAFSG